MSDVVQLKPGTTLFDYCFAVVREKRSWGLIVDVIGPTLNDVEKAPVIYPLRVKNGSFEYIGKTYWEIEV